jgi:hypothetical protein
MKIILWLGLTTNEELYKGVAALGRLRTTALENLLTTGFRGFFSWDHTAVHVLASHVFSFFFFFLKIYLFIICKYTVAVFRQPRRGHQISLRVVVSHHVVAGI